LNALACGGIEDVPREAVHNLDHNHDPVSMNGTTQPLHGLALLVVLCLGVALVGCGTVQREGLERGYAREMAKALERHAVRLDPDLEDRILALDASEVSALDVQDILSQAPAPRVVNIHGGVARVIPRMVSFSEFLIGMGYPSESLIHPSDGTYSFSCYESSAKIAGVVAWYYEKEGLRPMLVGHSQGGMQVVKVLHQLARRPSSRLRVWNPMTWEREARSEIVDPLTGEPQPVAGLVLPYATSLGAGGLTRLLPNQWDMTFRLRSIPDSVEEFTGFCKRFDLLGGDFLGYGPLNHYRAKGRASVRNVWLPTHYRHGSIPDTRHLAGSPPIREWIDQYRPDVASVVHLELDREFDDDSQHILWAADVWYSIKKHWVLELQRLIHAQRTHPR
jgi:hypothetical protein